MINHKTNNYILKFKGIIYELSISIKYIQYTIATINLNTTLILQTLVTKAYHSF